MHPITTPREQRHHPHPGQPQPPANYCAIPQRLLADLRDTPVAIGLYALVARLFLVAHEPVPLSRADAIHYDPSLKPGAVKRAFDRLVERGWLLAAPASAHRKQRYTPTWGRVKGEPLPWRMDAPCLGRPRHIIRLMLDRGLLDVCMGKLTPHATRPATVTRYITAPILGLGDIGAYALALGDIPHETVGLRRLGLVRAGQALPVPSEARLLAAISQLQLQLDEQAAPIDAALTMSGTRRLGVVPAPPAADTAQPLFFVPPGSIGKLIGPLIGSLIADSSASHSAPAAAGAGEKPVSTQSVGITWESRDLGKQATPPPTPSAAQADYGGGTGAEYEQKEPARRGARPVKKRTQVAARVPENPTTQLLQAINVLPEIQIELASMPAETVKAAIENGEAREGIRDLAGWVVKLLRTHRDHGWRIAPPACANAPEALRAAFARYAAEQEAERREGMPEDAPWFEASAPAPLHTHGDLTRLWNEVQSAIKAQAPRAEWEAWLRRLTLLSIENGVATIMAPSALVKQAVEDRHLGLLRELLTTFAGEKVEVRVVLNPSVAQSPTPSPQSPTSDSQPPASNLQPPDWIAPDRWATLPALLRAALAGSELVDGAVRCRAPHLERLVLGRYAREVEELIAVWSQPSSLGY